MTMPKSILSTIVFVGRELNASMFDERKLEALFGPLKGDQIKAGPIGQFRYSHENASFSVTPDRVDLRYGGREILPPILIKAGKEIAERLEPVRGFISAVGINCDAVFYMQEINKEGKIFCQELTASPLFQRVYQGYNGLHVMSVSSAFPGIKVKQYNVRLEPESASQGRDLVVAFNAHQDFTLSDDLKRKLDAIEEAREQVQRLHQQILTSRGG